MSPLGKAGIVVAGYVAALVLACGVVYVRMLATENNPDAQASSGMYAFGDAMLFIFAFCVAAVPPTVVALYFLRSVQRFWSAMAVIALLVASTGVVAAMVYWGERVNPQWASALSWWSPLAVLRTIVAPLMTGVFMVCAFFTPDARPRRLLWIAAVIEAVAAAPWFLSVALDFAAPR